MTTFFAPLPRCVRRCPLGSPCWWATSRFPLRAATANDPYCLATLKHYRSLMPLAQEARQPMFFLKPADGAIGGHMTAVQDCYRDFRSLAQRIAGRSGVALP